MAGCVNKVILIGNLGHDPEIRALPNGNKVASLSLATSERWKDKNGVQQDKTEWHRISVLNDRLIEVVEKFLKKGSRAYVEGSIQTRKWTDKKGESRQSTEVVVGRFRGDIQLLDQRTTTSTPDDDEIPF